MNSNSQQNEKMKKNPRHNRTRGCDNGNAPRAPPPLVVDKVLDVDVALVDVVVVVVVVVVVEDVVVVVENVEACASDASASTAARANCAASCETVAFFRKSIFPESNWKNAHFVTFERIQ